MTCGYPAKKGPCLRETDGRCWQHKESPGGEVGLPPPATVTITAWSVRTPADVVTPKQGIIALLQVSWQRWQILASMLEDQVMNGTAHVYAVDPKTGDTYASSEQVAALVQAEADERDRCARLAKQAHDMGIDDAMWMN